MFLKLIMVSVLSLCCNTTVIIFHPYADKKANFALAFSSVPPLEHGSAVQDVELRMDHDLVVVGAWTIKLAGEMDGLGNGGAREILGLTNP